MKLLLIIANIGTAAVLFPILKRQNESVALGYVTARVVECAVIAVGILSVLSVLTLPQEAAGADAGSLVAGGESLVAIHDWTSLLGPGFVVGVGNGLLLGYLIAAHAALSVALIADRTAGDRRQPDRVLVDTITPTRRITGERSR